MIAILVAGVAVGALMLGLLCLGGWGLMVMLDSLHHFFPAVPAIGYGDCLGIFAVATLIGIVYTTLVDGFRRST